MKLIRELGLQFFTEKSKTRTKFAIYECPKCKKGFRTSMRNVNGGRTTKCSTCSGVGVKTHGLRNHKLYSVWAGIKTRCYNKNDTHYKYYGEKEIHLCDEWKEDFYSFYKWSMKNGYSEDLSIHRIDNDGGYSPENCMFATDELQAQVTRKIRITNTSGFRGVTVRKPKNNKRKTRYIAQIHAKEKEVHIGSFDYPWTAGMAYDAYVLKNKLEHTRNYA